MSKFKIGDRVEIAAGSFKNEFGTVIEVKLTENSYKIQIDSPYKPMWYLERELELIKMQKKKTKTVKKYAVVEVANGVSYLLKQKFTDDEIVAMNKEQEDFIDGHEYHIVPTLFIKEEVPVETETRYTFVCKRNTDSYIFTVDKYRDLETAKEYTFGMAIQQIDSSAEEVEIE